MGGDGWEEMGVQTGGVWGVGMSGVGGAVVGGVEGVVDVVEDEGTCFELVVIIIIISTTVIPAPIIICSEGEAGWPAADAVGRGLL